jgi:hypothetical protein
LRVDRSSPLQHWVVAQRQSQTAALNMLGGREKVRTPSGSSQWSCPCHGIDLS